MADKEIVDEGREKFSSRLGFILISAGCAIGLGNIWRFPTLVSKWGGMTFLLPYFLFVILIGSTGVIGEFALGRAAGAGPGDAFGMCTEARWGKRRPGELVGYIPVLGSLVPHAAGRADAGDDEAAAAAKAVAFADVGVVTHNVVSFHALRHKLV